MKKLLFILGAVLTFNSNAQTAYITNGDDNTVSVINVATNTVLKTIPVGTHPKGVSVSPDGTKVYIANSGNNTVTVINTATNTVSATIPIGTYPEGIAISPDGSKVYVANDTNKVSVINTATNTVSATIPVSNATSGISISPDGTKVYVANQTSSSVSVINAATNTVTTTIPVGAWPFGISVTPDGSKVYTANYWGNSVSVINTATNTVSDTITVGSSPYAFGNFISTHEQPTTTPTNVSCYGGNNGTATVNSVNSGTPPYTYLWNTVPPQTTSTATGLTPGNYHVTITDANSMTVTSSVTITQPSVLNITTSGNKIICKGSDTTICAYTTGGTAPYTYLWSNGSTTSCQTVSPVNTTNYSVTVTDYNGCITNSSLLAVTVDSASKPVITQNVNILYSTAASSYQWYLNGNPINGATGQFYAPLLLGVYSVAIIAANGCSAISDGFNFVGIYELSISLNASVYPNPAYENLIIESPQKAVIEIYNIQGQLIKAIETSSNKESVNVSALPNGLYYVKVNAEKGVTVKKFIKE